ncbi:MAG TPA: hypothetical protein VGN26_16340 [Armatimonadota bacterium]
MLQSPFAGAFLDSELPGAVSDADRDYSRMLLSHYTETAFGRDQGEAKRLLGRLRSAAPDRFHRNDRAMISLLSDLSDPAFSGEMDSLVEAYRGAGDFHPDISLAIANYYEKMGERDKRDLFLRQIADRVGYEGEAPREAWARLGAELLRRGRTEEGRRYLWRAVRDAQTRGESVEAQQRLVQALRA